MALGKMNPYASPGIGTEYTATPRLVTNGTADLKPGGIRIDGTYARDPLHIGDIDVLRAGLLMGKRSSDGSYAPSIIGTLTAAHDEDGSSNTTMTVSAATATEINRRIGSSGTLKVTGPPTASGTVATVTVTYSAVNTSTGAITITDIGTDFINGSFVQPTDGSETMLGYLPDGTGYVVTDEDNDDETIDADLVIGVKSGYVDASNLVNWPSNAVLQDYIRDQLRNSGNFVLDYDYVS